MIIVGMPAYNESEYIEDMVNEVEKYADEVIVVDDGSCDDTAELAKSAGATVVIHDRNLGHGAAIISILEEAKRRKFDVLVTIDSDTQHNPDDIPLLVKPILDGYDLAIGARTWDDVPKYRYVGGKVLSLFTRLLSGKNITDSQSGFRAYSPKAVKIMQLNEQGTAWCSEMIVEASKMNLKIVEVPVLIKYTNDGQTLNPLRQGFGTLFRILVMIGKRMMGE